MVLVKRSCLLFGLLFIYYSTVWSQTIERPTLQAGRLTGEITIDGILNEEDWQNAQVLDSFLTTEPAEKGTPSAPTLVRVIATKKTIIIGVECKDPNPEKIIRFSKLRDTDISNEDHIKVVIDPFKDGQSGYILAVNANAARYDALVSNRGESENKDWDTIWEARVSINENGWIAEIRLPIQSIYFKKSLTEWGFNVERRIQRNQETIRWANVQRDQFFGQTSRAGLLTNLPVFNYGWGLSMRPSLVSSLNKEGADAATIFDLEPSLDASQRIGPNVLATITVNTDFAETEVDTRQTNLTRFPLFFPEKRTFFLEGSDIFEFGFGTGSSTVLPFFSRTIGLVGNEQVPIIAGAKINGRIGGTAFGGLGVRTDTFDSEGIPYDATTMGVMRIRQNVFKESSVGFIGSVGDPLGRDGSFMSGLDFTYQTTRFNGNKNFIAGAWALYADREDLMNDRSAFGFKLDYPNDKWDLSLSYSRIGEEFDPSLGFVPRLGIHYSRLGAVYAPRPDWPLVRQMFNELFATYIKNINGEWQSYSVFMAPVNWRLESGDRIEMNVRPVGENITEPFDIADNVTIPVGKYNFMRYRLEAQFAAKRRLNGQASWWFGSFYDGRLDELELELNWNPSSLLGFEFNGVRNIGRLPWGDFNQTLVGMRVRFNVTSDLQLNAYTQYDTDSRILGVNGRIHWIFSPLGEVFLVFNYNTFNDMTDRWTLQEEQILLKVRYTFRL
ncbi:carbohydrate binding family 9 domain-containing protein [uncultured Eudoraea sp.]|uniref:carbohydrate binding family 9 domain-containing protein n=1 Tax=uncultured Eudoraea sp. TaxID=1035614 RepID=UPI0026196D9D|nr:carbohydrate binding family 9 domain-containing protein [uncultured Eudoraea sp.]